MKKAFQKILSVVLTVIILFSMLSVGALAAVTEFIEGSIAYV